MMKFTFFLLIVLKFLSSFDIFIDSSYQYNDSDGTSSKPFKDSNIICEIIKNGSGNSFYVTNYFLISNQLLINNSASEIIFTYTF